jgi:hypothetical protein
VGWEDRDWAKWTDDERARFYGGGGFHRGGGSFDESPTGSRRSSSILLAIVVSIVLSALIGFTNLNRVDLPGRAHAAAASERRPVLYGTEVRSDDAGSPLTCTSMVTVAAGSWSCTEWSIVMPGQRAVLAAPLTPGTRCAFAKVDQSAGRWLCQRRLG